MPVVRRFFARRLLEDPCFRSGHFFGEGCKASVAGTTARKPPHRM